MAAVFPGMGRPLARVLAGKRVYATFSELSGVDVGAPACTARDSELYCDRHWELAAVATEAAALEVFRSGGQDVSASLGFSIGAYAALLAAGAITAAQVVEMIDIVLEASLRLPGRFSMLAVAGAPLEEVMALCRSGEVELSGVVVPGQLLIAGAESAVAAVAEAVEPVALRVKRLSVRWPLHTSLMRPVAAALDRQRSLIGQLRPFRHPVYSAFDAGRLSAPEEGWRLLVEHLCRPQRFDLAFEAARRDGYAHCLELGPCGTLERAVRFLSRDEVEVECFPTASVPLRRRAVSRC